MRWLLHKLIRYLLGDAAIDGITDEMLDGITLAIQEESRRMGITVTGAGQ